jgi:hypothetical protein
MNFKLLGLIGALTMGLNAAADSLRVVDRDNQPIANATVLIGYEAGNPFVAIAYGESADAAALEAMQEWKDKAK